MRSAIALSILRTRMSGTAHLPFAVQTPCADDFRSKREGFHAVERVNALCRSNRGRTNQYITSAGGTASTVIMKYVEYPVAVTIVPAKMPRILPVIFTKDDSNEYCVAVCS